MLNPWLVMNMYIDRVVINFFLCIDTEYRVSWLNKRNTKKKKTVIGAFYHIVNSFVGYAVTHTLQKRRRGVGARKVFLYLKRIFLYH